MKQHGCANANGRAVNRRDDWFFKCGDAIDEAQAGRIAVARFFAENIAVGAGGLEAAVTGGAESLKGADAAVRMSA